MKTPRNLQEYFMKLDAEKKKFEELKKALDELNKNVDLVTK
jgi:hypothetical protein